MARTNSTFPNPTIENSELPATSDSCEVAGVAKDHVSGPTDPEPFVTIGEASRQLGIKKFAVERAVRRGEIPHYTFHNSRKLVRVSEILAAVEASRQGGN